MEKKLDLSITIIGHNEEKHLNELLPTLNWVKEIIYVDCESQDQSIAIAQKNKCLIFKRKNLSNLNINKSYAISKASASWVFYLDPDERIGKKLKTNLKKVVKKKQSPKSVVAYKFNRKNFFFKKFLIKGGFYPDQQLRLFKNNSAYFPHQHVHERIKVKGKIGFLSGDLLHYSYSSISEYFIKFNFYTSFEAEIMFKKKVKVNLIQFMTYFFLKPLGLFIKKIFFQKGWQDGFCGFLAALFSALHFPIRYFKLWEITYQRKSTTPLKKL